MSAREDFWINGSRYMLQLRQMDDVSACPADSREASLHTLYLFNEIHGHAVVDGIAYVLHRHTVLYIRPGSVAKWALSPEHPVEGSVMRFAALRPEAASGRYAEADPPTSSLELDFKSYPVIAELLREIKGKYDGGQAGDLHFMKANVLFQELLLLLMKQAAHQPGSGTRQSIEATLEYMEKNYSADITRDKLAEMAGMSPDYYSRVFKKLTGRSPKEHLGFIRIHQAKQALVLSNESYRSIAQSAGFSDEFYFSRKFKALTGRSPSAYVRSIRQATKIASMKHLLTGHLLALGIEPYAAVINNAYPVTASFRNTISIGELRPDLEKLIGAKPDLILTCEFRDFAKSEKEKLYEQIAPTVTLPFYADWRHHFESIASLVGKEEEGKEWLARYGEKAKRSRAAIGKELGGESVLVLGVGEGKLCVYGRRNVGSVLYGDLGLAIPEGVERISHYEEITPEDLTRYDPDRIIVACYRHDGLPCTQQAIRRECARLFAAPEWQGLRAVRRGKVHPMRGGQHLYTCYTAYSHDLLLDKIPELLMSESSM